MKPMTQEEAKRLLSLNCNADNATLRMNIVASVALQIFVLLEHIASGKLVVFAACPQCDDGIMREGKAIEQTLRGRGDFIGDKHAVTLSPGGTGKLIDCMKCDKCGHSETKEDK